MAHEKEILQHHEFERELRKASNYVLALLPAPMADGPIGAEWLFSHAPSWAAMRSATVRSMTISSSFYMMDVSGHGAGAAMHSVAVMNLLRQRAVPGADMAEPDEVLRALNAMFPMEDHAGMYFTMWYGVYGRRAGNCISPAPATIRPSWSPEAQEASRASHPQRPGGRRSGTVYRCRQGHGAPGSSIYLFSDGVFEIVTKEGVEWGLSDFVRGCCPRSVGAGRKTETFKEVRGLAQAGRVWKMISRSWF